MQLKNLAQHLFEQPFVLATAIAAFLHSTWTVSTFFGGLQPAAAFTPAFIGWLAPGVLLAFSLDIGLLSTANKLARGEGVRGLRVTFFVLAAFMFWLQWIYIVHHIPAMLLSDGVRTEWQPFVTLLRDMAVWLLPALLPISVTLYTFSAGAPVLHGEHQETAQTIVTPTETQEAKTVTERPLSPSPNGHAKRATANTVDES